MTFSAPPPFTSRPTLTGTFGMSASTHWIATAAAQAVLERGGNAFDAAVAGGFVLHLAEPHLNGPGGDLVGIFATADSPTRPVVLAGQGVAPAAATIDHYRAEGLDLVPGAGGLAAAVPGAVDAWLLLLRDHGTWTLADVLEAAIGYAEDGIPLVERVSRTIAGVADLFRDHWTTSADLWLPDGEPPAPGALFRNPAYASVLRELAAVATAADDRIAGIDAARREWKTGRVAQAASRFLSIPHRHSAGGDHAAVITTDDFAGFSATYEDALTARFGGAVVAKAGAWTQGPVLLEALRILEPLDDLDPGTEAGAHALIEALKLALADRDAHFGDGAAIDALLADDTIAARRANIGARASREWRPAHLSGREPFRPPLRAGAAGASGSGEPTVDRTGAARGDTCHIDVVDRWGNIVAATPSGGWLQSSPTIPELGFCLGTRLQMTWLDASSPSALRPGARPRTTLSPTLVLGDDGSATALGTPGGDQQEQWQLPVLLRMLVGGWSGQEAIDAPSLHTTALVDSFWPRTWDPAGVAVEDRIGADVIGALEERGHVVTRMGDWSLGRVSAVGRDAAGLLWAAANPRGMQGYAAGR